MSDNYELLQLDSDDVTYCGVPKHYWKVVFNNESGCRVFKIQNSTICQVFWMYIWYKKIIPLFRQQTMVNNIYNVDLQSPVILDENLKLYIYDPYVVLLLRSKRQLNIVESSKKSLPFKMNSIFMIYTITVVLIFIFIHKL